MRSGGGTLRLKASRRQIDVANQVLAAPSNKAGNLLEGLLRPSKTLDAFKGQVVHSLRSSQE